MLFQSLIKKYWYVFLLQCSISECKLKAEKTVKISFRETRNLCKNHYKLFSNKNEQYVPNFTRASKFQPK